MTDSSTRPHDRHDCVIIGGGHNGLVAAFYLAQKGFKPLVLERRSFVGGACVTEEFAPGYRASTGAYVLSLLRPKVLADMRLVERGLKLSPSGPTFHIYDDGSHLWLRDDVADCRRQLSRFAEADAEAYPRFMDDMQRLAGILEPIMDMPPPDLRSFGPANLMKWLRLGRHGLRLRRHLPQLLGLFTSSATAVLNQYFTHDSVKAAFAWHALNDSSLGPSSPGTAFVLIHDAVSAEDGSHTPWGFVIGGMQRVSDLMAEAAVEAGSTILTDAEVSRVVIEGKRATGVELVDGRTFETDFVISNADPIRTLHGLVGAEHLPAAVNRRLETFRINGTSIKINLAVDRLPRLSDYPVDGDGPQEYHHSIVEFHPPTIADMDWGADNVRRGVPTLERMNIEMCFPTVHDPGLAPAGRHIVTIDSNTQPYLLDGASWDDLRDPVADAILDRIEMRFPGLKSSVIHRQVLTPLDLERTLGLTGGHALHGDMSPDQLFFFRPLPDYPGYGTPIEDLYLCGAGTHPGGGVTGANGRNAALDIARRRRRR